MALSMDEQRVLAEIERRLAAEDPGLAACLSDFRRPGPAAVLRSPRARIIGSLFTVLLVATVSLMVYAMIPFRAHGVRLPAGRPGTIPSQMQISAAGSGAPGKSGAVTASAPASLRHASTAIAGGTGASEARKAAAKTSGATSTTTSGGAASKSGTASSASSTQPQARAKATGNR
jgi:Protein of unknown function (DUF3040)